MQSLYKVQGFIGRESKWEHDVKAINSLISNVDLLCKVLGLIFSMIYLRTKEGLNNTVLKMTQHCSKVNHDCCFGPCNHENTIIKLFWIVLLTTFKPLSISGMWASLCGHST